MGTVSDDIGCCESVQKRQERRGVAAVAGAGRCGGDGGRGPAAGPGADRPGWLLKLFTKNVLQTALNEELTEHLGYDKHQAGSGRSSVNVRKGTRSDPFISDAAGEIRIDVPRDREGTFESQIVKRGSADRVGVG